MCVCVGRGGGDGCGGCACVVTTSCNIVIISPYAMHPHKLLVQPSFSPPPLSLPLSPHPLTLPYHAPLSPLPHSPLPPPTLHIPHQTLFNPNKTVVKIFVVTFDFSDMPPNSQTFLRQKTLSRPCHIPSDSRGVPAIHYLIHLR